MKKPRVIVFDIETSFMKLMGWGLYDQHFSIDHILEDWTICNFAAKVVGKNEWCEISTRGRREDKALVEKAIKFLETADVLVSQNGIRFDIPKLNARAEINELGPNLLHRKMHVDLLLEGRRLFGHSSHKLAWITKLLTPAVQKSRHSKFDGVELWKEVDKRNPEAIKEMAQYNRQDVLATEAVYKRYIMWLDRVNLNLAIGPKPTVAGVACRICSGPTVSNGSTRRTNGNFRKYLCRACNAHTIPTSAGFNLDSPKRKVALTPSGKELEKLRTETKLLAKELKSAQTRVESLLKSKGRIK